MKNSSIILPALSLFINPFINPFILSTTTSSAEARNLVIVGGYNEVDAEDEQLLDAADFVLTSLFAGESDRSYSFSTLLFLGGENDNEDGGDDGEVTVKIVEAESQVVAGMNYRMTLGLFKDGDCLGAFKVTVYDQFGDMSVTSWGDEVSCDDIDDIKELYSFNFDTLEEDTKNKLDDNLSGGRSIYETTHPTLLFGLTTLFVISIML